MTRHRRMPPSHAFVTGVCRSGKKAFWTKAGARALVRVLRAEGDKGVRAYHCPDCDYFHVGHLPYVVRRGQVAARDAYPTNERPAP